MKAKIRVVRPVAPKTAVAVDTYLLLLLMAMFPNTMIPPPIMMGRRAKSKTLALFTPVTGKVIVVVLCGVVVVVECVVVVVVDGTVVVVNFGVVVGVVVVVELHP